MPSTQHPYSSVINEDGFVEGEVQFNKVQLSFQCTPRGFSKPSNLNVNNRNVCDPSYIHHYHFGQISAVADPSAAESKRPDAELLSELNRRYGNRDVDVIGGSEVTDASREGLPARCLSFSVPRWWAVGLGQPVQTFTRNEEDFTDDPFAATTQDANNGSIWTAKQGKLTNEAAGDLKRERDD
ncbi:hypothetical protein I317_06503 [Kwoniella heveanensis CBS 569]|nr:hypothetical protein I317_06503 [Kwoniella heveanensis CBS 569]